MPGLSHKLNQPGFKLQAEDTFKRLLNELFAGSD